MRSSLTLFLNQIIGLFSSGYCVLLLFADAVMKSLAINSSFSRIGGVVGSLAIAADTKIARTATQRSLQPIFR